MTTEHSDSNKSAAEPVSNLIAQAQKLTAFGFPIVPLNDKVPIIKYKHRRKDLATIREMQLWFSGNGKPAKANGIAIAINNTEFGIDTDGDKCESIFLDNIVAKFPAELQEKIKETMHTKTKNGHHRTFRILSDDFPKGINDKTILKFDGHNEIAIKGKDHIFVERGPGYEIINDIECIVTLSQSETMEILEALDSFKANTNGIRTVLGVLKPHFKEPSRHKIALALAGFLHKGGAPRHLIIETIERLASETNDPEISDRLKAVQDTCDKARDSKEVSGYKALLEALENDKEAIAEIQAVINGIGKTGKLSGFSFDVDEDEDEIEDEDDLKGIDQNIIFKLKQNVYSIVSTNPAVMYVAHAKKRKIIRAVINYSTQVTTHTDFNSVKQQDKKTIQSLHWKQRLIMAIPIKVIINNSPIDENKTYQITFVGRSKKPFTIGPASINSIIDRLDTEGKVIRKPEATDALKAILQKYEESEMAEINESVTTQGYYFIKDKFETHNVTQVLDRDPDPYQMLECTGLLDELSTKWHDMDIFPSVIKWFTLAPFDYIFKAINKWQTNFHCHGWSSSGKTSLGKIGLAIWRLHNNALKKDFQLGIANIDNVARLGFVISKSTYPPVINEVGALREKINRPLLEITKLAIESPFVRGKWIDGKYQNIPALRKLFMTSNPRPPDDSGYRSKTTIVHHGKEEVHERGQKEAKEFEKWLESQLHLLGVLGDFIARYVIIMPTKPEDSIIFSKDMSYDDIAKEIIAEFYKAAGREDRPEWLDRVFEQRSIIEENTELAYFQLRGFLMEQITDAYSRHINRIYSERDTDPKLSIDFRTRLSFCLANKLVPYLHEHTTKDKTMEIRISRDILATLHRKIDHLEGVTTMQDLVNELPGFEYINGKIGPKAGWILAGKREDFIAFLEGEIEDQE